MRYVRHSFSRLHAFGGIAGGGLFLILLGTAHQTSAQQQSSLRLKFPAGSHSNRHSHS